MQWPCMSTCMCMHLLSWVPYPTLWIQFQSLAIFGPQSECHENESRHTVLQKSATTMFVRFTDRVTNTMVWLGKPRVFVRYYCYSSDNGRIPEWQRQMTLTWVCVIPQLYFHQKSHIGLLMTNRGHTSAAFASTEQPAVFLIRVHYRMKTSSTAAIAKRYM